MNYFKHAKFLVSGLVCFLLMTSWFFLGEGMSLAAGVQGGGNNHLYRAKVYLAAGDYRRAVEACQLNIDQTPSVESYVYLLYVYHAIVGYQEWLAHQDKWGDVGRLAQSMVNRGAMELVDPPNMLSRMAKEILDEGVRQQFDIVAGMANRLNKGRVDELWLERKAWEKAHPETWWAGVPGSWDW